MKQLTKIVFVSFCVFIANQAAAQNQKRAIKLSGIVFFLQDSISVLSGVHVYVPLSGRGTTTNKKGFFSLGVQTGDSVVFSAVGYKRRYYSVPDSTPESTTLNMALKLN